MFTEHQHAPVRVDKQPVVEEIPEQPEASQSQASSDDESVDYSVANIERIYRKLDRRIISAFWILYFLCSAIRSNRAQPIPAPDLNRSCPLLRLLRDLRPPSNLIMTRLSPHVWDAALWSASAAVVGLVSAGFQKMDGTQGLVGFQWMFLIYGVITVALGFALLWWLQIDPRRPGADAACTITIYSECITHPRGRCGICSRCSWIGDLSLLVMYFGVVGVGIGVQLYANVIIKAIDPTLSDISLSLLTAPIWIMDLIAILLVTPLSDRFHRHRAIFFSIPVLLQILGLLLTSYAGTDANPWPRYGGLLIVGFGLGPTVPITMTWTTEVFQPRHGELGVAAASAVVSGLGNLGSILTTYALYSGWKSDYEAPGREKYRKSNLVMIGILAASILSAALMEVMLRFVDGRYRGDRDDGAVDGAARREVRQRGFHGIGAAFTRWLRLGR
ncbi:hypothetical protein PDIDSM_7316 [Penicillium digitatum]|nr:hypothetical protein PDIDSM_7316 [Penicillium digitatum]